MAQVEQCVFPWARDRLDCARGDEAVTGTSIHWRKKKKKRSGPRGQSVSTLVCGPERGHSELCVTVKTFTHVIAIFGKILTICHFYKIMTVCQNHLFLHILFI